MTILETADVEGGYGNVKILHGVDLRVQDREMVAIIGPNGAGKSTLLKTIVGLLRCQSGTITFEGEDITNTPPEEIAAKGICYIPQSDNIFSMLTVLENIKIGSWTLNDEDHFEKRLGEIYEMFPILEERESQKAGGLSGGQQQMVALASALIIDPDLLILDEPSAGLSPDITDEIFEIITDINAAGTAILMVEQNARKAVETADRGVILASGEDQMEGSSSDLLESEEVAELYLG